MNKESKKLKITLVDDDQDDREYFADAVNEILSECELTIYKDGQKVMDDILNSKFEIPDLLFLDLNMPILSGKKLLEEMRKFEEFKKIPIISLTAKAMKGDREKAISAGASDYVTKPVDPEKLLSAMYIWLKKSEKQNPKVIKT